MTSLKVKFRPSTVAAKEGTLYYQVIHNRMVRQISTGYRLFAHEWNGGDIVSPNATGQTSRSRYLDEVVCRLRKDTARLQSIIQRLERQGEVFTSEQVIDAYLAPDSDTGMFCAFARSVAGQMKRIGKERLSETYYTSANSFLRFRGVAGDIPLEDVDADLMVEYEAYLQGQGLVSNTTSFYMRNLRAIYNRAVEKKLVDDRQPFKHVYTGIGKTVKRAVSPEVMSRIKKLDLLSGSLLEQARDLFMFSFYTRGMSFIDMAHLKKKDLQNGVLVYRRQKTGQQLFIKWEPPMQEIVSRYADPESPYLLPIITRPGEDERRQYLSAIHRMNTRLKEIGNRVNATITLTSYVSRHGWASIAKSRNVPITVISEAMGHDSESTTRIYLASLDSSVVDNANSKVIYSV